LRDALRRAPRIQSRASAGGAPAPRRPAARTTPLQALDDRRNPLAEPDAHRLKAVARVRPLQLVQHGRHELGARAAEGMAEGNGAPVDVDAPSLERQLAL